MRKQMGTLPADLRKENQRKVMKYMLRKGETTIADIAENLDISRLTVKKCVDYYIDKGIMVSCGKGDSTETGGKKPLVYGLCEDKYMVCIQLHRHEVIVSVVNMDNKILYTWLSGKTEINNLEEFWRIAEKLTVDNMDEDVRHKIQACCVVVPIITDANHKITVVSPFPKWPQTDIGRILTEPFARLFPNIILCDVISDSCAAGAALIEEYENMEKNPSLVTFYIYQGVGGAIFQNGETDNKFGRAWGHIIVREEDEEVCHCGAHGCLEKIISRERMRKRLAEDGLYRESILSKKNIDDIEYEDLFAASQQGDKLAQKEVCYCAKMFSAVVRNVILSVEPDCIYVQGDFGKADDLFKAEVLSQLEGMVIIGNRYADSIYYDDNPVKCQEIHGAAYLMLLEYIDNIITA